MSHHPNPFHLDFEEILPLFSVAPSENTVFEGPAPVPFPDATPVPVTSIRIDQQWGVRFKWETQGNLNWLMAGTWELTVYLERMGGGEFNLPGGTKNIAFVSAPNTYTEDLTFPAGSVPEGAYRIVTTVTMKGPSGFRGPIGAIGDGPVIQFYKVGL